MKAALQSLRKNCAGLRIKGLNCAWNIYAAVKEADDGYIFSNPYMEKI